MNILICDDNRLALEVNFTYVKELSVKYKIAPVIYKFNKYDDELANVIKTKKIDIAFLDIDLENSSQNGMDIAKTILENSKWCNIIFITNHKEYANEALDLLCFAYLSKPIEQEKLEQVFEKVMNQVAAHVRSNNDHIISFTSDYNNIKLRINTIHYIEKRQQKLLIKTRDKEYVIYDTIKSVNEKLNDNFIKIDRGLVVNKAQILYSDGNTIRLKTGEVFSISRSNKKKFYEQWGGKING